MSILRKILIISLLGYIFLSPWAISLCTYADEGLIEDIPIEISADMGVNSKYIWRGLTLDDDPVMQQGIYISASGFSLNIWSSLDIDADDSLNSDEVDYVLDYTYRTDNLSLSIGHIYYDFPGADGASREFYLGASLDIWLSPGLTWFHDYGDEDSGGGDGDYIELALGQSIALGNSPLSLELGTQIGYNRKLFIQGDGGNILITAGLSIPLSERCNLSPNINYSFSLGGLKDTDDGNQKDKFYSGFTLSFNF